MNKVIKLSILGATVSIGIIALIMWGLPNYKVWQQGLAGRAALTKSQQTKQIKIEQAKAEEQAASYRARAIKIIGQASKDYPEYRKQEFMGSLGQALEDGNIAQIIYLPTETGLPILEARSR